MSTAPPAVTTTKLTKRFGSFTAVDGVDLAVQPQSVLALLGPNGAGKTTIVRMLATLSAPTSGSAAVCGYDVVHDADLVRSVVSLTGQFAALEANLTCRENLILIGRLRGYGRAAATRVADRLIERLDITEFRNKLVKSVSGGQRRRVDLAASLVTEPRLLVLDEPTTGLDPRSRQVVWSTVRNLVTEGVTVLLTTQYLEEADALADRIVLMDHGHAVAEGSPAELKAQIGEQRVDIIVTDSAAVETLAESLRRRFTVTAVPERRTLSIPAPQGMADLTQVAAVVTSLDIGIDEVALRHPTLDDAFLALTGNAPAADTTTDNITEMSA